MVVEIVTESLDVGDVFVAALRGQVSGEQHYEVIVRDNPIHLVASKSFSSLTKGDVAHLTLAHILESRNSLELERGVTAEENLGRILQGHNTASGINEFLFNFSNEFTHALPELYSCNEPAGRPCQRSDPSPPGTQC